MQGQPSQRDGKEREGRRAARVKRAAWVWVSRLNLDIEPHGLELALFGLPVDPCMSPNAGHHNVPSSIEIDVVDFVHKC